MGLVAMNSGAMFLTMALRKNIVGACRSARKRGLSEVLWLRGRRGSAGMRRGREQTSTGRARDWVVKKFDGLVLCYYGHATQTRPSEAPLLTREKENLRSHAANLSNLRFNLSKGGVH